MLLKTRFYIPPLRETDVIRHRLINRFTSIDGGELALVIAPAGYGKTTAVSQWLHHHPHSFAWLVLDQSHSGDRRFWQYVIAALQTMIPSLGEAAQICLEQDKVDDAVISLLNDLDAQSQSHTHQAMTLVLDDFHKIANPTLSQSINVFLDHLPPSIRLIITSREVPSLQLPRRRSRGQLHEIGQSDLAFDAEEMKAFIRSKLQPASDAEKDYLSQLLSSTEGWVAGMQLAAMSYQTQPILSEAYQNEKHQHETMPLHRDVADYLFEEVFTQLTPALQKFLLLTAIPKRFCAALANELCQEQTGQSNIKQLDQFNVFLIPLDNHRVWYRYHDLFRQLLLQHASELSLNEQQKVHRAAAYWFENSGYPEDAIHHWVKLQEWKEFKRVWLTAQFDQSRLITWQHLIPHAIYLELSDVHAAEAKQTNETGNLATEGLADNVQDLNNVMDQAQTIATVEPLTNREKQVMGLVKKGLSNKDIAEAMHISLNTLKVHIRNLYGKMGVENRTQALLKMAPDSQQSLNSHK